MEALLRDVRHALRALARAPGHAVLVVAILAVGIGATTAVFSVVEAVLLRPLPYREPERLAFVWEKAPTFPEMSVSYLDFVDWRERSRSFEGLALFRFDSFNLSGLDRPERVEARRFSAGMLAVLGVQPALGRDFTAEEDRPGGAPAVLVQDAFWRTRLGASPGALGRTLVLDGRPHTIVGVLPPGFRFAGKPFSVVVPCGQADPGQLERGDHPGFYALGRLARGVTLAQARDELEGIGRALGERYEENRDLLPAVMPLRDRVVRDVRSALLLLMAAVAFVLCVAVANVANLSLARALARRREMAIRAALGAGRARLVQQVLVENAVLGLAGGVLGVVLALWGVDVLAAARPDAQVAASAIEVNVRVLLFALAAALASGLLAGLAPALMLSEPRLQEVLRASELGSGGSTSLGRVRAALVVAEVALACALLAGATLSLRAFARLQAADPGFRADHVLTMNVSPPAARYRTAADVRAFQRRAVEAISAVPGVRAAALSLGLPLVGVAETSFAVAGRPRPAPGQMLFATFVPATPRFHEALRIPLLEGRYFTERDRAGAPRVVIVDEVLARTFFPGGSAVGQRLTNERGDKVFEIVGVVPHLKIYAPGRPEAARYQMYWSVDQLADEYLATYGHDGTLTLLTQGPPLGYVEAVRRALASVDGELPPYDIATMERVVADSVVPQRFATGLLGFFAAVAVLLAAAGVYGVMAHAVSRRTHEIGVRMALGAQPSAVQRMVLVQGLRIVGAGLALGLGAALALGRFTASVVPGAGRLEPAALAAAAAGLLALALGATWLPARRATRVDPVIALREE